MIQHDERNDKPLTGATSQCGRGVVNARRNAPLDRRRFNGVVTRLLTFDPYLAHIAGTDYHFQEHSSLESIAAACLELEPSRCSVIAVNGDKSRQEVFAHTNLLCSR